jgi:glucokinase
MSGLAISVDLGGTQVRAALVDRAGAIVKRVAVATQATAGPDTVVAQILTLIEQVRAGVADQQICGVGVSSPGPLDTVQGLALSLPTLSGFESFALKAAIQAGVAWPVQLENDGIAAAIGEWQFGAGRGLSDLVYVTVSTGIGGGVISGNRVVRGRRGMAGHVGHMIIVPDGALCKCGVQGCFEAYGAGPAFRRLQARLFPAPVFLKRRGKAMRWPWIWLLKKQKFWDAALPVWRICSALR